MVVSDSTSCIHVSPVTVTVCGTKDAAVQTGVFVSYMDYTQAHPMVKGVPGPNVRTALNTLRRVIRHDYWIPESVKCDAFKAINDRLAAES